MTVIVVATGLVGFGVSVALLALGVSSMPLRYLVAVLAAYGAFLLLIRLWVEYQRRRIQADADGVAISPDIVVDAGGTGGSEPWVGGGGGFGGGGAGRAWESSPPSYASSEAHSSLPMFGAAAAESSAIDSGGSQVETVLDVDLDDGWAIVAPVVLLCGGLFAVAYIIYTAPVLLAEVFLDVVLVSGLYRTLRKFEPQSWMSTAVRKTWAPIAAVAVLVVAAGFVMQTIVPQADSIGDVLKAVRG